MKDWIFGVTMAAAVALYPNLIDAVLYHGAIDEIDSVRRQQAGRCRAVGRRTLEEHVRIALSFLGKE